jgi:hypothetical protein
MRKPANALTLLHIKVYTRTRKIGNPAATATANIALSALLGSFCGCLNVWVISGLGPHRSGGCGFVGEESFMTGLTEAN